MRRKAASALLLATAGLLAGCGNAYRATIGTNNPVPVPTQPAYFPAVLSSAGEVSQGAVILFDLPGEGTVLDLSGDTVLAQVNVGIQPIALAEGLNGGTAYAVDLGALASPYQAQVSSFGIGPGVQTASVTTTSLNTAGSVFAPIASTPVTPCNATMPPPAVFSNASLTYVTQTAPQTSGSTYILPLSRGISGTGVPALEPAYQTAGLVTNYTGLTSGTTTYAIERDTNTVDVIGVLQTATPPAPYPIVTPALSGFSSPTFGVTSVNGHRVFILNCNGTITPIDAQSNSVMTKSIITLPAGAGTPIWGDYYNGGNLLVTANTTSVTGATTPGSASIINASENAENFGLLLGTATVGINPSGVAVLQDGTRAYVSNEGDDLATAGTKGPVCDCKSVSVVSLTSNTTVKTIPLYYSDSVQKVACPANGLSASATYMYGTSAVSPTGYPLQIATAPDTTDEKVYVLCDQPSADGVFYVFSIRTFAQFSGSGQSSDADVVSAVIPIQGIPTQLRMTPAR